MANITQDLQNIMSARYGKDVRQSIHDAIRDMNVESSNAQSVAISSRDSAKANADLSKSYAVGGTGTRTGEATDNAKYYKEQSEDYCGRAEGAYEQISIAIQMPVFTVNYSSGLLMYTNDATYDFSINRTTGNLEWEVVTT